MNEEKNKVPQGRYTCKFVSASRSNAPKNAEHFVLTARLLPIDSGVDNPCEYFADIPLVFRSGVEYGFYNADKNCNEKRKCTSADTQAAISRARACIPEWAAFVDALPESASYSEAFAWFNQPHEITVRALIKEPREYNGKLYYDATIIEPLTGRSVIESEEEFNASFGKSLKAAGIKFGGKAATAPAKPAAPVVAPAKPSKPVAPSAPVAPVEPTVVRVFTSEEVWGVYEGGECIKRDPQGAKFYDECARVIGKPKNTYKAWTSDDWKKCFVEFGGKIEDDDSAIPF